MRAPLNPPGGPQDRGSQAGGPQSGRPKAVDRSGKPGTTAHTPSGVRCDYCAFACIIPDGQTGRCGVRENAGGTLRTRHAGKYVGPALDPVEKKPLYHYRPGTQTFSLARFGCNFRCDFCQNYHLVDEVYRSDAHYRHRSEDELMSLWRESGKPTVAFTYSEPAVWQDSLHRFSALVRGEGGRCIVVSNGFYGNPALDAMMESAEAFNIDLKGSEDFYKRWVSGRQGPVMHTISALAGSDDHHLEVTSLLIEGEHSADEILRLADQLAEAGVRVWHLSLFHPAYRMDNYQATKASFALEILDEVRRRELIPHLYLGNARIDEYSHTMCPACGLTLIRRSGLRVLDNHIDAGRCPNCKHIIYGSFL